MPKVQCLCGQLINLSPIPNPQGFKIVWEPLIEKLVDNLITAHQQAKSDEEFELKAYKLLFPGKSEPAFPEVYECFHCKRLVIFTYGSDNEATFWYQQEEAKIEVDSLCSLIEQTIDN